MPYGEREQFVTLREFKHVLRLKSDPLTRERLDYEILKSEYSKLFENYGELTVGRRFPSDQTVIYSLHGNFWIKMGNFENF